MMDRESVQFIEWTTMDAERFANLLERDKLFNVDRQTLITTYETGARWAAIWHERSGNTPDVTLKDLNLLAYSWAMGFLHGLEKANEP